MGSIIQSQQLMLTLLFTKNITSKTTSILEIKNIQSNFTWLFYKLNISFYFSGILFKHSISAASSIWFIFLCKWDCRIMLHSQSILRFFSNTRWNWKATPSEGRLKGERFKSAFHKLYHTLWSQILCWLKWWLDIFTCLSPTKCLTSRFNTSGAWNEGETRTEWLVWKSLNVNSCHFIATTKTAINSVILCLRLQQILTLILIFHYVMGIKFIDLSVILYAFNPSNVLYDDKHLK